jgi:hypothetical protein
MTGYPLYGRLGRPQGRSGWVLKISSPPGFDPRTVELVAKIIIIGDNVNVITHNSFIIRKRENYEMLT